MMSGDVNRKVKTMPEPHNNEDQRKREELISALSLELGKDLNLSVYAADADRSNMLLDLLRLQFVSLIKQLDALVASSDKEERRLLSRQVRAWLNSLNNAPLLPLSFRLKHLGQLESYLDVLAKDMGSLILRSYKVGILHLKEKSTDSQIYLREIVNVAGIALDLSSRQLSSDCMQHFSHSTVEVRQSLDIARLGLLVAQSLPEDCNQDIARLKKFVVQHELIRRMDLYSCANEDKKVMLWRVSQYAALADVEFLRAGETIANLNKGPFLVSQISKPHNKPKRMACFPTHIACDVLVISAAGLLRRVLQDLDMVNKAEDLANKGYAIRLEGDVSDAKVCGDILMAAFRRVKREKRTPVSKKKVDVGVHVGLYIHDESEREEKEAEKGWVLHNLSHCGAMLQCDIRNGRVIPVGAMLSFEWPVKTGWPQHAIVRHVQVSLQGYERLGVEFIRGVVKPATLKFIHRHNAIVQKKVWPVLLERFDGGWRVWLGSDDHYHSALTVSIQGVGNPDKNICRIYPTGEFGCNYSIFKITEVLTMSELRAMTLVYGQEDEKKRPDELHF